MENDRGAVSMHCFILCKARHFQIVFSDCLQDKNAMWIAAEGGGCSHSVYIHRSQV